MSINLFRRALDQSEAVTARVLDGDLGRPTPCAGWDLRALLGHVIGQHHGFAAAVAGGDAPRSAYASRPPAIGEDLLPAWRRSADALTTALREAPEDRHVVLAEIAARPVPLARVVDFQLLDTAVHAWDVATALGESYRPDDEIVAAVHTVACAVPEAGRGVPGAAFGRARPEPADDPWVASLALLGRLPVR